MSVTVQKRKKIAARLFKKIKFEPTHDPAWGKCTLFMEQALIAADNLRWYLLKSTADLVDRSPGFQEFLSDRKLVKDHWNSNFGEVFSGPRSVYFANWLREFHFAIKLKNQEYSWLKSLQKSARIVYFRNKKNKLVLWLKKFAFNS
jgi:hypothetical protein